MQSMIIDFQGTEYEILNDFGSLKVIKDANKKEFLFIPIRGLLIEINESEINFHRSKGCVYLHGVAFKTGRIERKRDSDSIIKRSSISAMYEKVSVIFFTNQNLTELQEVLCAQYG